MFMGLFLFVCFFLGGGGGGGGMRGGWLRPLSTLVYKDVNYLDTAGVK